MVKAYIDSLKTDRTKRTRLALLVAIIAVVIFAAVFWTMRFIGITMTDEAGCGMLEHTHTEECYERVLICKTPEGEEHTHTDECYEMVLICGKEEHTHTALCYPDTSADVESPEDWEATLPASDNMTGDWAKDLVAVAQSQVGYRESERNYNLNEDGSHSGYTRFGAWYGSPYIDWNATFIAFCLNYAKIPAGVIPYNSGVEAMMTACDASKIISSVEGYSPAAGDIAFIDSDGDGKADSVAVISSVLFDDADSASALTTTTGTASGKNKNTSASTPAPIILVAVEGDIDGEVKENIYTYSESGVLGFLNMEELREKYIENTPTPSTDPDNTEEPQTTDVPENTAEPINPGKQNQDDGVNMRGQVTSSDPTNAVIAHIEWDEDDTSHGSISVTVQLYRGTTLVDTQVLSSSNNWTYAFTGLTSSSNYKLVYDVPEGYADQVDTEIGQTYSWTPIGSSGFSANNVYAIVERKGSSGSYTYRAVAAIGTFSDYLENVTVVCNSSGYPVFVPDHAQWKATSVSSKSSFAVDLNNVGASDNEFGIGRYFYIWPDGMSPTGYSFGTHISPSNSFYGLNYNYSSTLYNGTVYSYYPVMESTSYSSLADGYIYTFVDSDGHYLGVDTSGNVTSYDSNVSDYAKWKAAKVSSSSSYFYLMNCGTGTYLSYNSTSEMLTTMSDSSSLSTSQRVRLSNGYLRIDSSSEYYVYKYSKSSYYISDDTSYRTAFTAKRSSGTQYYMKDGLDINNEEEDLIATTSSSQATKYNIFVRGSASTTVKTMDVAISLHKREVVSSSTPMLSHKKQIDWLGEGTNTDAGIASPTADDYRIYLDVQGKMEALDVLLVVDLSSSMEDSDMEIPAGQNAFSTSTFTDGTGLILVDRDGYAVTAPSSGTALTRATKSNTNQYQRWYAVQVGESSGWYSLWNPATEKYIGYVFGTGGSGFGLSNYGYSAQFKLNSNGTLQCRYYASNNDYGTSFTTSYVRYSGTSYSLNSSSSTSYTFSVDVKTISRIRAVNNFLNGVNNAGNGFINRVYNANSYNKLAVVTFGGNENTSASPMYKVDSSIVSDWFTPTASSTVTINPNKVDGGAGTDYCAGLYRLQDVLESSLVANDGNRKVVVFISDGAPSYALTSKSATSRIGSGSASNPDTAIVVSDPTFNTIREVINAAQASYPDIEFNSVAFHNPHTDSSFLSDYLESIASRGNGAFYEATSGEELEDAILSTTMPKNVEIIDTLSAYVDYNETNPALKVTMTKNGTTTVLWQNGAATSAGSGIIESCVYENGQIKLKLNSDHLLDPTELFTISFNVKVNDYAKAQFTANQGYSGTTGDYNTDYGTNETSSFMPGFYSNTSAELYYELAGVHYSEPYAMPVVQTEQSDNPTPAQDATFEHDKVIDWLGDGDPNPDTQLTGDNMYRLYLDWTGEFSKPYDLMLVIDKSASMLYDINGDETSTSGLPSRETLVERTLNGYGSDPGLIATFLGANDQNRISIITFGGTSSTGSSYSYNTDSAVVTSPTWTRSVSSIDLGVVSNTGTNYCAGLYKAQEIWASSTNPNKIMIFISDGVPTYWITKSGSTYTRGGTGLEDSANVASAISNTQTLASSFHSALPDVTCYSLLFGGEYNRVSKFENGQTYRFFNSSNTFSVNGYQDWTAVGPTNSYYYRLKNSNDQYLYYNGSSFTTNTSNYTYFSWKSADDPYLVCNRSSNPSSDGDLAVTYDSENLYIYKKIDLTALNSIASNNQTTSAGDYASLVSNLNAFIYPSDVTITDTLSKYVRFDQSYGGDLKVTRVNKTTGVIEDLYIWPNVTTAGNGIIESVTYTEGDTSNEPTDSTGTITVKFVDGFTVDPNYKYTLSFNVNTTKTAENEKADNEANNRPAYSVPNPNYDANDPESSQYIQYMGDLGTDFVYTPNGLVNTSSSTMPGFRSNQQATVSMTLGGTENTENYDHPVVQVNSTSGGSETVENFEKSKTIDWLGDGEENPNTDLTGEEYYRLYLNWSGEFSVPYDLLIVVDTSASMLDGVGGTTNPSSGNSREAIVESILNGTNGIIRKFLNANEDNQVALIKFDGNPNATSGYTYMSDSSLLRAWGRNTADVDLGVVSDRGTNYEAGLRLARNVLNNSPHQNKIMIFLSDGVPTYWLVSDNERGGTGTESSSTNVTNARTHTIDYAEAFQDLFPNVPMYGILFNSQPDVDTSALAAISTSGRAYTATSGTQLVNYFNMATSPSNMKIVDYLSQYVECDEGLGVDIVVTCVNKTTGDFEVLYDKRAITDAGRGIIKPDYPVYTPWADMTADEKAAHPNAKCTGKIELQFVDSFAIDPNLEYTLSFNVHVTQTAKYEKAANVAYYEGYVKGDPTVTVNGTTYHLFNEDGTINTEAYELLDETTNPTKAQFDAICNLYCPEGTYDAYVNSDPTVTVNGTTYHLFNGDGTRNTEAYELLDETTNPTKAQFDAICNLNYPEGTIDASNYIGDPGTDYAYNANGIVNNNSTSSLMPGFRSNDQATVSYTFGTEHSEDYDHPVVQVTVENEEEEDTSFHNSKVIDWLGDEIDNPDTDVDDAGGASAGTLANLYRLYLDMSGKQNKGCDLMIIVDQSNSMNEEISSGYTRIDAVNDVLWGKVVSGSRSGGLVKDFLDANDGKNRICILGFGGAYTSQSNNVIPYPYANDTTTFRMWGRDATPIEISAPTNWGTNYCAALRLAQDAWDQVYAENTNKLMIFLSDGEPSFYMRNTSDGLRRYGNGTSSYINSTTDGYTMSFYDTFRTGYPKVHTESVGFGSTFNTTVLNYFAKNGDPSSSAVALRATDYESLLAALKAQIYPSSIVISDALSKYVRYYSPDADMKVTMKREIGKDATTGDPIYKEATIFENGAIVASAPVYVNGVATGETVNGADFLRRVSYTEGDTSAVPTSSTGTVEVEFNPEFVADPSYTFTVSFNVIATQTAYNAEQNGVAHNIGDEDTDYPGNNTSSGKLGYFSNDSASRVTYNIGSATQEDPYDKPVIQGPTVEPPELGSSGATATATKTWDDENDKYQLRPEYVTVRLYADGQPTGKTAQLSADNNWTFTWTDLPAYAEDGVTLIQYSIEEDYVYGYTPTYAEPTFTTTGEREFKLIYYPNEGTGTAVEETYNNNTGFTTTAKDPAALGFSRTGYNFTGWNTKPDGTGTSYAVNATVSLANGGIALYAQWEQDSSVNTYTITFRRNGATSGTMASATVTTAAGQTSASYTLPDPGNTYTYEGYTFAGWAMGSASGTVYQPGDTVTISADTTFYATWTQTVSDLDRAMNVSGGTLHFESTDTYPWTTGTSGEHFYGTSGNAGQNSTSSNVTTTVTLTEASTLTFEYYYSSENGYDKCYFYIDGTVQSDLNGLSGSSSGWIVATYTLSAGTHTLKWTFTKDRSTASGNDQFWVDNVAITAGSVADEWEALTGFTSGDYYYIEGVLRFVDSDGYALTNNSGNTVTRAADNPSDEAQWWTATSVTSGSSTYFTLTNVKTGRKLYYNSSSYALAGSTSSALTLYLKGRDSSTVYLYTTDISSSGTSYPYIGWDSDDGYYSFFSGTTYASVFTVYQKTTSSGNILPTPNWSVGELPDDVWNRITVDTTDANFFLLNGKTVVLTNGQGLALANDAGTTVNYKAVNENDPAQQWVVSADVNSATFALRNVKTGYYLNYVTTRGEIFFTADAQNAAHSKLHSVSPNTFRLGKFDASDDTLALCSEILTVYQHKTAFNPDPDSSGVGSGKVGGDDDQHIEHSDIVPVTSQQPAVSDSNSASAPTKAGQGNGMKANSTYTLASELEVGSRYLIVTKYGNNYYVLKNTEYSSNSCPETTSVSISSNSITGDYTDYQFLVGGSAGAYTFYNENNQKYLGLNSSRSYFLYFGSEDISWAYSSNYLVNNSTGAGNYVYFGINSNCTYANSQASGNASEVYFYKLNSSTPSTPCTITYMANGSQYGNSVTANSGSSIALPATAPAVSGWTFSGWVEDQISNETTTAPTFYGPGDSYTVTGDATLYALYTREEAGTGVTYNRVYTLENGKTYIIVADSSVSGTTGYAVGNSAVTSGHFLTPVAVTINNTDNTVTATSANLPKVLWVAAGDATNGFTFYNSAAGKYMGITDDDYLAPTDTGKAWFYTAEYYLDNLGDSEGYRYLTYNTSGTTRYTTGKTSTTANFVIRLYAETPVTTTYYTTAPSGSAPSTVTVTFKDHDGTILKTQTVSYGGSATPPANPTRVGYTFTGWSGSYTNVTANTEVTAQYSINVYTLTINYVDTNGQTVAASYTHTYDYNAPYSVTSPTVSGYTTTQTVVSGNMPAQNETITVVYTANGQTPEATETTAPTPTAVPTAVPTVTPVPTTAPTAQPTATPAPTETPAAEYIYVRTDHFENGKEYVICIGNYALGNTIYTSGGKQYTIALGVTANNDQVAVSSAVGVTNVLWTVSGDDTNGWILQNVGNGRYLGFNADQYMIPTTIQADSIPWFYSAGTFRNYRDSDGYYFVSLASDNSSFTTSKNSNTDVRIYVKTPVESTTEFTVNWFMGVTNKLDRKPLQVDKHVAGVNGPALYGAQFTLVRADESFEPYVDTDQQYLAFNAISDIYGQVIFYDVMPGSDGNAYGLNCLPYGNYVLTEVSAPDGHEIVGSGVWHVIVDENGARVVDENGWPIANDSSNKPAIVNMPTYELADTGGMGVYGFTAVGGMLMLVPAVYAIVDRRRRKRSSN